MSDVADDAQAREEMDRKIALDAMRARVAEAFSPRNPDVANWCIDCDGAIEPARLRALTNTARCASCAHDFERGLREGHR